LIKPYYEHGGITIYNADCREVLPELGRFDLLLTDPPYGINYKTDSTSRGNLRKGIAHTAVLGDDKPFEPEFLLGIADKTILWGANAYGSRLPSNYGWIVWDKRPNGERNSQSDAELAWTSFMTSVRTHRQRWMGCMRDGEECPFVGGALVHPTQKPLALMKFCISLAGKDIKTIIDPFMGSGTTLLAAKTLGIKAIGIELEEKYCEIAADRLAQRVMDFAS
jgi:site-specific DNA-methyltransferase (adenine-specific)